MSDMLLEYVTLFLLVVVVLTRYFTTCHVNGLTLQRTELENEHAKLRGDYNALHKRRDATEAQIDDLKSRKAVLENELEDAKEELDDAIDRNEDLEGN